MVHLCSNAADLVANVVAVELATGALNFISVLKLLLFTLKFVDRRLDDSGGGLCDWVVNEKVDHACEHQVWRKWVCICVSCCTFSLVLVQLGH